MNVIIKLACCLLVVSGLIMGYEGLTDKDLVEVFFGANTTMELVIDSIFGVSAIIVALGLLARKI